MRDLLLLFTVILCCNIAQAEIIKPADDIEFEGYRIYIGEDKTSEGIDVYTVLDTDSNPRFVDKSPIVRITHGVNFFGERFLWIEKENSIWKYFPSSEPNLHLVEPVLK